MLVVEPKEVIAQFVSEQIKGVDSWWDPRNYSALGLVRSGQLIAGLIYTGYRKPDITVHIGAIPGRRWLTREFLYAMCDYPFNFLDCGRVTIPVKADNAECLRFVKHFGFTEEGRLRKAFPDGQDLVILGLLKNECRWLSEPYARYKIAA